MKRYILKLGGSVITDKQGARKRANRSVIRRLAREIRLAREKVPFDLILICGVGSFGHPRVVKYGLDAGVHSSLQKKMAKKVENETRELGNLVCTLLKSEGLPMKYVNASRLFAQRNKKVTRAHLAPYIQALRAGKIPLSTGTMVPDSRLHTSVLSGDRIIAALAQNVNPDAVFLGTDVGGIFTEDPKDHPRAKRISRVTKKNLQAVIRMAGHSKSVDVTQGMRGKIEKIGEMVHGCPVLIFNLFKKGDLKRVLLGKPIKGTRIHI